MPCLFRHYRASCAYCPSLFDIICRDILLSRHACCRDFAPIAVPPAAPLPSYIAYSEWIRCSRYVARQNADNSSSYFILLSIGFYFTRMIGIMSRYAYKILGNDINGTIIFATHWCIDEGQPLTPFTGFTAHTTPPLPPNAYHSLLGGRHFPSPSRGLRNSHGRSLPVETSIPPQISTPI